MLHKAGAVESRGYSARSPEFSKITRLQPDCTGRFVSETNKNRAERATLDKFALNSAAAGPIFGFHTGDGTRCLIGADPFCQDKEKTCKSN